MMRCHAQTAGVSLTAQQPENNIVRVAIQALAAVLGGCQSLHTNSMDEALALPTEQAALIALRTQQIIAHETGVTNTIDPVAGSYAIESLTNEIEARALEYIAKIDAMGGMIKAIEAGFVQSEIQRAAYDYQRRVENKEQLVVGVNELVAEDQRQIPILRIDSAIEKAQVGRLKVLRAKRDTGNAKAALGELERRAKGSENRRRSLCHGWRNFRCHAPRLRGISRIRRNLAILECGSLAAAFGPLTSQSQCKLGSRLS